VCVLAFTLRRMNAKFFTRRAKVLNHSFKPPVLSYFCALLPRLSFQPPPLEFCQFARVDQVVEVKKYDKKIGRKVLGRTALENNGNLILQKYLGTTSWDKTRSIIETIQGGYIVAGETDLNFGFEKYSITMLDVNGVNLVDELFGGTSNDYAKSILRTTDGGYIVAGTSSSNDNDVSLNNGLSDIWIVKLGMSLHIEEQLLGEKEIVKILNLLGQATSPSPNTPLIYIFADGTPKKVMRIE
jgi:hypothetical protein